MERAVLCYRNRRHVLSGSLCLIGRDPECDVALDDPAVSRQHALIVHSGDHYVVLDYKSSNGVLLNDQSVFRHDLRSGDQVRIGDTVLLFRIEHHFKFNRKYDLDNYEALLQTHEYYPFLRACFDATLSEKRTDYEPFFAFERKLAGIERTSELLDAILDACLEALEADHGFLALFGRDADEMQVAAARGIDQKTIQGTPFYDLLMRQAFGHSRAVMTTETLFDYFYQHPQIVFLGIQSAMCVPLLRPQEPFGVLYADRAMTSLPFAERHLKQMAFYAYVAALRLETTLFMRRLEDSLQQVDIIVTQFGRGKAMFCEVCGERVNGRPLEDLVICLDCNAIHHRECWQYNKGCSIYGCQGKRMKTLDTL